MLTLISILGNLFNSLESIDHLSKAISLVLQIAIAKKKIDIQNLIQELRCFPKESSDSTLALIAVIVGRLEDTQFPEGQGYEFDPDDEDNRLWLIYLEELREALKQLNENDAKEDKVTYILDKVIRYISRQNSIAFEKSGSLFLEIMREIYREGRGLGRLIFSDTLMSRFLKEYVCAPQSSILLDFINSFYAQLQTNMDFFQTYGTQFFSKVKSFLNNERKHLSSAALHRPVNSQILLQLHSNSNSEGNSPTNNRLPRYQGFSNEKIEGFTNMFRVVCVFVIKLINHESNVDFSQYFKEPDSNQVYNFNDYLITKVLHFDFHIRIYFWS